MSPLPFRWSRECLSWDVQRLLYKCILFRLNFEFSGEKNMQQPSSMRSVANIVRLKFPLFCFPEPRIFQGQDEGCRSEYGFSPKEEWVINPGDFDSLLPPSSIQMTVLCLSPQSQYRHHYHHHSYHLHAHLTSVEMDTDLNWGNQNPAFRPLVLLSIWQRFCLVLWLLWEFVTVTNINIWLNFETDTLDFLFGLVAGHSIVWIAFKIIIASFT